MIFKQSFCGRMPFLSPTSRNGNSVLQFGHLLDLIFSLTTKIPEQGRGITPFTSFPPDASSRHNDPDQILKSLHWLKVQERIDTKLFLPLKVLQSSSPHNLRDITIQPSRLPSSLARLLFSRCSLLCLYSFVLEGSTGELFLRCCLLVSSTCILSMSISFFWAGLQQILGPLLSTIPLYSFYRTILFQEAGGTFGQNYTTLKCPNSENSTLNDTFSANGYLHNSSSAWTDNWSNSTCRQKENRISREAKVCNTHSSLVSCIMTFESWKRLVLMYFPSAALCPVVHASFMFSDPARSTRFYQTITHTYTHLTTAALHIYQHYVVDPKCL